jgi:hypothetical protein
MPGYKAGFFNRVIFPGQVLYIFQTGSLYFPDRLLTIPFYWLLLDFFRMPKKKSLRGTLLIRFMNGDHYRCAWIFLSKMLLGTAPICLSTI